MDSEVRRQIGISFPLFYMGIPVGTVTFIRYQQPPPEWYAEFDQDHWLYAKTQQEAWEFLVTSWAEKAKSENPAAA